MASRPATDVDWPVHQVFELLHEALVVTEAELDLPGPRILYANPAFSRMTGYSLEEILGQTPRFLQGPETDRRTIARLRRCLESGETFNGEAINYRKDGTPFMMRWYIEPIRAADGCITHFFAVQRDVTQELAANTQQRALEQAIEQLDDSVVLFGRDGRVGYVNDAFRRSWSGSEEPILGQPVWKLPVAPRWWSEMRWARKLLGSGQVWKREYAVRASGSRDEPRLVFATVSPIRDAEGDFAQYLAIIRDVTELRRLETIAQAHNFHDSLGGIFSGIRHELGNPINSIKSALQLLTSTRDTMPEPKLRDYLSRMREEIGRVEYLLRSLRSYSLYDKPRLESVDLRSFLQRFLQLTQRDSARRGVRIELQVDDSADTAWADPQALHQVLLNLIGNATAACGEHGLIEVRVESRGSYSSLFVLDDGPGIPADRLAYVFEPFYTTRSGGTGLGLPICRHLLSLMRGSIELQSTEAGTEAHILLDRRQPARHARAYPMTAGRVVRMSADAGIGALDPGGLSAPAP